MVRAEATALSSAGLTRLRFIAGWVTLRDEHGIDQLEWAGNQGPSKSFKDPELQVTRVPNPTAISPPPRVRRVRPL